MGGTCSVCQNSYKFDPIIDNNIIETTNSHKQNSDSLKHSSPILNVNTLDPLFANNTPNQKTLKLIPMDLGFSRNFFESDYQNYINLQKKSLLMYIINSQTLNINELVYEGQINENNERHGKGVLKWPNGTIYIGDWFLNKANGRGIISFPKFEHYEGLFINNTFEGEGVYFNCQGTRFEGLWSNNYPEGLGIETYSDGSKYEGNYSRGKKNGKGFIMFADGGYYEGEFKANEIDGFGVYVWPKPEKILYKGNWKNNKLNGIGKTMWINSGKLYYGSYLNNEKNGLGIFFCGLSKSWVGYWKDGYKDGPGINITEGNIMRNELWKNGRKNESECDINNVMFDEIQLFYEKAQKELFENYDFILLIYANGICQLYDLIDCKIIFQEKIVKNPKHLRISLHNYFFYSDPISNKIYYTPLKNPFETKRLDELPSKGFPNPFDNIFSSTIKPLQKEVLNEIYAESILKFAPFKDNEIVLLFETIGDTEKDYYINKISIYTIPEGKLLNQNSILSVDVLLHNYLKIIDDNFVVIFPLNQTFGEECPLNFYIIKIVDKKENEYKVVLIPSDLKGQLKGLNGYYSQGKLILCIFFIKNGLTENNVAFIEIDFQESENITSNVIRKILDIPQPNEFIFFYNEGNFKNEAISQLFKVMLKDGSSLFNLTRINYTTLEIEEIKSLEIERIIVNNPFNFRYSIEFDDESYKEDKLNKINQKYFKLHMIGCNQSIAFIFLLEKAKIMEKYGRHIVYEIIDFLI